MSRKRTVWAIRGMTEIQTLVLGDGVEIVVAVEQAGQTLLDDIEKRFERREFIYWDGSRFAPWFCVS